MGIPEKFTKMFWIARKPSDWQKNWYDWQKAQQMGKIDAWFNQVDNTF